MTPIIAPSILAADFANLEKEIKMINDSDADWIHVDVMDGVFVPNISLGIPIVQAIKRHAQKPLDVHLMITEPENYVEIFYKAGASSISVHEEATTHLHRLVQQIKSFGIKAGVALNPHTPIAVLENIIEDIDLVCLMSVNPGFGGQSFIKNTYKKTAQLRALIRNSNAHALIEIDGGVNKENARRLIDVGADILVAGNFVFSAINPKEVIQNLKSLKRS
jgi:ribulose-phosphate 3-epimerase